MKHVFEIGISMKDGMYSVTLNVTGEYGCTSPLKTTLISALYWCVDNVYDMKGDKEYENVLAAFQKMFPNDYDKFTLPF